MDVVTMETYEYLRDVAGEAERGEEEGGGAGGEGDKEHLEQEEREGEVERVVAGPDAAHGDLARVEAREVRPVRRHHVIP
jgi:hypothetical protein